MLEGIKVTLDTSSMAANSCAANSCASAAILIDLLWSLKNKFSYVAED